MNAVEMKQSFTSRYAIKKALGSYSPWLGYSVTDSLSGKDYLLFSLLPPEKVSLSSNDLRMRDFLFANGDRRMTKTLSLQEFSRGIIFLFPHNELIPMTKALPSMRASEALELLRSLGSSVLKKLSAGKFFHNLNAQSLVMIEDELMILPTAYLLPGEVKEKLDSLPPSQRCRQPLFGDLNDLGEIFSIFSPYLTEGISARCEKISDGLKSVSTATGREDFFRLVKTIASFIDDPGIDTKFIAGRQPPIEPAEREMTKLHRAAYKARDGDKQLVLVNGANGNGKTTFLEEAVREFEKGCGLKGSGIIDDHSTFKDSGDSEENNYCDYIIFDDHAVEPLLCGYIIDRLSRDLSHLKIAVVAINEDSPPYFLSALREEAAGKRIGIVEIELPRLKPDGKRIIFEHFLPPGGDKTLIGMIDAGKPLSLMNVSVRMLLDPGRMDHPAPVKKLIDLLTPEEKSVLHLIAVFRFQVPLSILQSVYSTDLEEFYTILQKLITLGLVTARGAISPLSNWELCLVFSISSRSLSKTILSAIPTRRKKELHINIAQILKELQHTPLSYIFYHLANCGERAEAAFKGYEIFQLFLSRKKVNAINCFNEGFMSRKLDTYLPPEMRYKLLLDLGNFFSIIGNMEKAESLYRRCREETKRDDDWHKYRTLAVEAIRKECEILEKKGDFVKAQSLLKKTLDIHGEHIISRERARLYNDLAWIDYRLGHFDKSWDNCLLVHRLLDKKQHFSELAQSYNLMGAINWNRSKYDDAIHCHKRCLALREDCNDEIGVAASYNNLGLVYRSMGRVREALECFTKSMNIKQRNNNLPGLAAAHLNIALTYLDLEDIDKAESNCITASRLAEDIGNQQLLAEIWGTMGEIYFLKGDHDSAREYYFRDLHICQKTRSMKEKAVVFRRLSELSLAQGKLDDTGDLLDQAAAINQKIGSRLETVLLELVRGKILLAEGKRDQGKTKLETTSLELSLLGKKDTAASVTAELGELYLEDGNETLAREYLLRATSLVNETDCMPLKVRELDSRLDLKSAEESGIAHSDTTRFRALCKVISLIRTVRDPEKLHRTITENARRIMNMERAALILQKSSQDSFHILDCIGDFGSGPGTDLTDKNVIAILDIARQLGYPLDISRTMIPPGKVSQKFLAEHPGIICTPLWIQDEVTGFLYLDSPEFNEETSDEDHIFLVGFSQQLALGLERIMLSDRIRQLGKQIPSTRTAAIDPREIPGFQNIVGRSAAIRNIFELVEGIKDMDTTVLLTGPSGSGKDLIAKTIHSNSPRRERRFHSLNCAAFPHELLESALFGHEKGSFTGAVKQKIGFFESAAGGTIFLNEIGDMPLSLQPKLLHVLEEGRFYRVGGTKEISTDARVIAATNRDLLQLVKQGLFREDLYFRINIFPIRIPGLKERREDIELLCDHFLTNCSRLYNIPKRRISPEAMLYLNEYEWPGNVRELENTIKRLMILSRKETILPEDLPENIVKHTELIHTRSLTTLGDLLETLLENVQFTESDPILPKIQNTLIHKVVEKTGDKTKAARILGISKPTLYTKLRDYERDNGKD